MGTKTKDQAAKQHSHRVPDPADSQDAGGSEEYELKLEVDASCTDALLAAAPLDQAGDNDRIQHTVYFDTPSRSLQKAGFSLRVRTIGGRHVQTIKAESGAAAGLFVRPEWECAIDDARPVLDKLGAPFRALVLEDELVHLEPVFYVDVSRKTALVDRGGAIVEVVLDRGEIVAGQQSSAVHEVELELKCGHPAALFGLARDLDRIAPLRLGVLT